MSVASYKITSEEVFGGNEEERQKSWDNSWHPNKGRSANHYTRNVWWLRILINPTFFNDLNVECDGICGNLMLSSA